jgi:hypothetical protein
MNTAVLEVLRGRFGNEPQFSLCRTLLSRDPQQVVNQETV